MVINTTTPASASGNELSAENQTTMLLPPQYQPRSKSEKELKTFLDEKEMLELVPVCRKTLFNWVQAGKLPCIKIGRRKIWHRQSVETALLRLQRGGLAE